MNEKPLPRDKHEANRLSWNAATQAHNSHKLDQAAYLRDRGHTLFPEELALLGNLQGKRLVHLQCNAGQDTLSLVKFGAIATGVDISDSAIEFAKQLSLDSGLAANFVRADVYDWLDSAVKSPERFDIFFSSYGAICWLSDLRRWADRIGKLLIPGGKLVLMEFHPFISIFEDDWSLKYNYFTDGSPQSWNDGVGDYVALSGTALSPMGSIEGVTNFTNDKVCHEWIWTVGDILESILSAGLSIKVFKEYPYSNGAKLLQDMVEKPGRRMYPPERLPSLPLMYGLVAEKQA